MSTTQSKKKRIAVIDNNAFGLAEMKEFMEKKLDDVEKRIDEVMLPFQRPDSNLLPQPIGYYENGPLVINGNGNALTPHEVQIKKESFNRGLEAGLYIGAGIALLCFAKIFR